MKIRLCSLTLLALTCLGQTPPVEYWIPLAQTNPLIFPDWYKLGEGFEITGKTITVKILLPPGTNTGVYLEQVIQMFIPEDFKIIHTNGLTKIAVNWATPIEGGLGPNERDFILPGITNKPRDCRVFRDGILQSWVFAQYDLVPPTLGRANWMIHFNSDSPRLQLIRADCY